MIDSTFTTPYLMNPFEHGVDLIMHSLTKFMGGHGLAIAGALVDSGRFDWYASGKFPTLTEPYAGYHGLNFADEFAIKEVYDDASFQENAKVVKEVVLKKRKTKATITDKNLEKYLGVKKYRFGLAEENNQVGEVTGLAWTSVGGDLLTIEATAYKGKGKLNYTGQLGDVMKESIQAAMSVTRTRAKELGIADDFQEKLDIHIHVPDGSTPKDGPSAGAAMCTALVSVLTGRKVKADVAMTGEITLRGEITPIGGLKEKMLAALRGGIKTVIIPDDNERELSEVPEKIKGKLNVIKVKWIDEVLDIALEK